ncbi:MAG TPA: N-acetyltransferase [Pyrinomonadaceae bacterium]|nr:N-acetyltransferase [Pyrinomonadaceae bacterium]
MSTRNHPTHVHGACRAPNCAQGSNALASARPAPPRAPHAPNAAAQAKKAAPNSPRAAQTARAPFAAHAPTPHAAHARTPQPQPPRGAATAQRQAAAQPARQAGYRVLPPTPLAGGRQQIRVAVSGTRQVAGSVDLRPTDGGKAYISNLKVGRDFRRQGLAGQLMDAALRSARVQGFKAARLEAHPSDEGITPQALVSMYSRMGFRSVGRSRRGNPLMERNL